MKSILPFLFSFLVYVEMVFGQAGIIDSSFGINGKVIGDSTFGFPASVVRSDGKLITLGFRYSNPTWIVTRYDINGNPDSSFGNNGHVLTKIGNSFFYKSSLALQNDGKILIIGHADSAAGNFMAFRLNNNGTLDSSFASNGISTTDFEGTFVAATSVAVQNDGKIVLAGEVAGADTHSVGIVRLNEDGSKDSTFGVNGKISRVVADTDWAYYVAIQPDAKIVVATSAFFRNTSYDFVVLRFTVDGVSDSTFGLNGMTTTNIGEDYAEALAIQPDGKILLAGYTYTSTGNDMMIARYNNNGSPDSTFSDDGKDTVLIGQSSAGNSLAIQPDGRIIVGGSTFNIQTLKDDFALLRYHADGSQDSTFGLDGIVTTDINNSDDFGKSVNITPDGKIDLAGDYFATFQAIAIVRYLSSFATGTIDLSKPNHSIFIYPNPIHSTETLQYSLEQDENLSLNLFDMNGKLAQSFFSNQKRPLGNHTEQLNFDSSLPRGNYELVISNGKNSEAIQLTKQ